MTIFGGDHPDVIRDRVLAVGFVATSAGGGGSSGLGVGRSSAPCSGGWARACCTGSTGSPIWSRGCDGWGARSRTPLVDRYSFDSPVSDALVRFAADA